MGLRAKESDENSLRHRQDMVVDENYCALPAAELVLRPEIHAAIVHLYTVSRRPGAKARRGISICVTMRPTISHMRNKPDSHYGIGRR